MKPNDIQDAIGMIGDDLIDEVGAIRGTKKKRFTGIIRYASVAACICIAASLLTVAMLMGGAKDTPPVSGENAPVANATESGNAELGTEGESNKENQKYGEEDKGLAIDPKEYLIPVVGTTTKISEGIRADWVTNRDISADDRGHYYGFTTDLFRENYAGGGNTVVSPLSVYFALSMLTNGAEGNTLAELETTLGMERDDLNEFVNTYLRSLKDKDNNAHGFDSVYESLISANSIWFDSNLPVKRSFLTANATHYYADIFSTDFSYTNSSQIIADVNAWVSEKTNGMIPSVLDSVYPHTEMLLINTLTFDGKWKKSYSEDEISDGIFTSSEGTEQTVKYLSSIENMYIEDENTTGFVKYYRGNYAFAALLPSEGISIDSYVEGLTGEKIMGLFDGMIKENIYVTAKLPEFESRFTCEDMIPSLKAMGISDVFDRWKANLSGIADPALLDGYLYVNMVIHKANISVTEYGTKASASTVIGTTQGVGNYTPPPTPIYKTVTLDRPFVYMIIDCNYNMPLFIGVVENIGE